MSDQALIHVPAVRRPIPRRAVAKLRPFSHLSSPREAIRQFTPNWFTATMGTGILALALNQLPLPVPALHAVGQMLWEFDIVLFALFSVLYAARWIFFYDGAKRIFGHSVVSMFLGAIPMALATIINGVLVFGIPIWGDAALSIAVALWWIDAAMAFACGLLVPYLMFTRQDHSVDKMTAVWLLPIVACEVTAASGAQVLAHLPAAGAIGFLLLNYVLWALSVPLAMSMLVIIVLRLVLHKLPHRDMAASSWLALGPIGTGALGLLLLGQDSVTVFAAAGMPMVGEVAHGLGIVGGAILWGYGIWWLGFAVIVTLRYLREGLPFNIGWWGFTFPLGVYAVGTLTLAAQTHVQAFADVGTVLVAMLAVFWLVIAPRTMLGAWRGELFVAPCLMTGAAPAESDVA
jgi:C4-dicarboxylate transporter/malic acid transport protein